MRLIDANAFKEYLRKKFKEIQPEFKTEKWRSFAEKLTEDFCMDIDEQPTIDAYVTLGEYKALKRKLLEEHAAYEELKAKAPQWIPASERLPEESGTYIVEAFDGNRNRITTVNWGTALKWNLSGARAYWNVIAWMPLPEPYREEQ